MLQINSSEPKHVKLCPKKRILKKKKLKITDHFKKLPEEDNKSEENIGVSNISSNDVHDVDMTTLMIPREKGIVSVTFRQKRDMAMVALTIIMRIIVCIFPSPSI